MCLLGSPSDRLMPKGVCRMKKVLFLATIIAIVVPCVASADTVRIVSKATVDGETVTAEKEYGFRPMSPEIKVAIQGKTCTLRSAAAGSVPMGCNYTIAIAADGTVSGELRAGNAVCTQSADVADSCK